MNDEYSDAFKSIVPEAPSSDGWAEGAHRKRRNRTRLVAGIAGAAVIALAVPVALSLTSNALLVATPPDPAAPSPDPASNAPGAAACWDGPGQVRHATLEGATDGAVQAWLCGDASVPASFPGAVGPLEPLVGGVGDLVDFIQSQPERAGDVDCTAEYTLTYRIVLEYGDGTSRVVPGALHGCRTIHDGSTVRTGGQGLYDLALDLWTRQRERVDAPGDVSVKQCPPPSRAVVPTIQPPLRPMLPLSPVEAVTGFACVEGGEGENWFGYSTTLQPDLVSLIARSVGADSVEGLGQDHLPTLVTIAGPWGEALTLQRTPDDTFQWFDVGTPMLWKPSATLLAKLDAPLEAPPMTRPPSEPVTQPTSVAAQQGCAGAGTGEPTTALPGGMLPDDPAKIWLCVSDIEGMPAVVGPLEPLESPALTADAAFAYNISRNIDFDPVCLDQPGPRYTVVHEYADGTTYVVAAQVNGCDVMEAGGAVREGGQAYVDTLLDLWTSQRAASPVSQTRPGPLCPQMTSIFPIDALTAEFTVGQVCVGTSDEVPLRAEVVADLSAQMASATTGTADDGLRSGGMVVLTAAGDPLTLNRSENGIVSWRDAAEQQWSFVPTGRLAEALDKVFSE